MKYFFSDKTSFQSSASTSITKPFLALCFLLVFLIAQTPLIAGANDPDSAALEQLTHGDILIDAQDVGNIKFVTGKMIINEPPSKVWPIMTNPFEFKGKISPRVKSIEVITDKADMSVLKMTINYTFLFPHASYVVESHYVPNSHIEFKRVDGIFKDFRGSWHIEALDGGSKTQLTYSMYVDPGFAIPQWLVREAIKMELPRTLMALRSRIVAISDNNEAPESRSIMAATHSPTCLAPETAILALPIIAPTVQIKKD
jgi:ribosome-associated toxin RatA of RatAB toxin-antitoxin module